MTSYSYPKLEGSVWRLYAHTMHPLSGVCAGCSENFCTSFMRLVVVSTVFISVTRLVP